MQGLVTKSRSRIGNKLMWHFGRLDGIESALASSDSVHEQFHLCYVETFSLLCFCCSFGLQSSQYHFAVIIISQTLRDEGKRTRKRNQRLTFRSRRFAQPSARQMEPFPLAPFHIARNHLSEADAVAVAIQWLAIVFVRCATVVVLLCPVGAFLVRALPCGSDRLLFLVASLRRRQVCGCESGCRVAA